MSVTPTGLTLLADPTATCAVATVDILIALSPAERMQLAQLLTKVSLPIQSARRAVGSVDAVGIAVDGTPHTHSRKRFI